jgi:hypothetical protein
VIAIDNNQKKLNGGSWDTDAVIAEILSGLMVVLYLSFHESHLIAAAARPCLVPLPQA